MFSFRERLSYQEFCVDEHSAGENKQLIRHAQIGVDPWDLFGIAETEDLGYDEEEEDDAGDQPSAMLSTFTKLELLELLVARIVEDDDDEVSRRVEHDHDLRRSSLRETQEAKDNFDKTMREKNPGVKVAYEGFEMIGEMR